MPGQVVAGIDIDWLDRLYAEDPVLHALAVWDLSAWPEAIEFRTLVEGGRPTAYLLFWRGLPRCPVVHWVGPAADPAPLLAVLPPRPFLAVVPPEVAPAVVARGTPAHAYPLELRRRRPGDPPPVPDRPTRRLEPFDAPALRLLAEGELSSVNDTYLSLALDREWVVGGFDGDRLVSVARAEVRLPRVWHLSGVYTHPDRRHQRWGEAVVAHLLRDATRAGAGTGLFVREDNAPARALYDRLGFDRGTPRIWIDAGAGRPP